MTSGRLYSLVTKHWARIAAGLVVVLGLVEFAVGGLTADSGLEFYLLAWGATTGGLWFLFEKAESSLSEQFRHQVTRWLRSEDIRTRAWAIPEQFAGLFDLVFTSRHWSRECFYRSCLASSAAVIIVFALKLALGVWSEDPVAARVGALMVAWAAVLWVVLVLSTVVVRSRWWRLVLGALFLALFLGPEAIGRGGRQVDGATRRLASGEYSRGRGPTELHTGLRLPTGIEMGDQLDGQEGSAVAARSV